MHLPAKPNRSNLACARACLLQAFRNRTASRSPPITRVLLRPPQFRGRHRRVLRRCRTQHSPRLVEQHCPCPAGPDVNPQKFAGHSSPFPSSNELGRAILFLCTFKTKPVRRKREILQSFIIITRNDHCRITVCTTWPRVGSPARPRMVRPPLRHSN